MSAGGKQTTEAQAEMQPTCGPPLGPSNPPQLFGLVFLSPDGFQDSPDFSGRTGWISLIPADEDFVEVVLRNEHGFTLEYVEVPLQFLHYVEHQDGGLAALEHDDEMRAVIRQRGGGIKQKKPKDAARERERAEQKAGKSAATASASVAKDRMAEARRIQLGLQQVVSRKEVMLASAEKKARQQQKIIDKLKAQAANAQPAPSTVHASIEEEVAELRRTVARLEKDLELANSGGAASASNDNHTRDLRRQLEAQTAAVNGLTNALIAAGRTTPLGGTPRSTPQRGTPRGTPRGTQLREDEAGPGSKRKALTEETEEFEELEDGEPGPRQRQRRRTKMQAALREPPPLSQQTHQPLTYVGWRKKKTLKVGTFAEIFETQQEAVQRRPEAKEQPDEKELWKAWIASLIAKWDIETKRFSESRRNGRADRRVLTNSTTPPVIATPSAPWWKFWDRDEDDDEIEFSKVSEFVRFCMKWSMNGQIKDVYIKNTQGLGNFVKLLDTVDLTHPRYLWPANYRLIVRWTDENGYIFEFPIDIAWITSFRIKLPDGTVIEVHRRGLAASLLQPNEVNWLDFVKRTEVRKSDQTLVFDRVEAGLVQPKAVQSAPDANKEGASSDSASSSSDSEGDSSRDSAKQAKASASVVNPGRSKHRIVRKSILAEEEVPPPPPTPQQKGGESADDGQQGGESADNSPRAWLRDVPEVQEGRGNADKNDGHEGRGYSDLVSANGAITAQLDGSPEQLDDSPEQVDTQAVTGALGGAAAGSQYPRSRLWNRYEVRKNLLVSAVAPQGSLEQQDTHTVAPTSDELQQQDVVFSLENDPHSWLQEHAESPAGAAACSLVSAPPLVARTPMEDHDETFVESTFGSQ